MKDYKMPLNTVEILGIPIISASKDQVLKELVFFVAKPASSEKGLGKDSRGLIVFTPNPEFLVKAREDFLFRELLKKADINLPDGIGLVWASRILETPIKERISGADVVEKLLEIGNRESEWMVGITGARRGDQKETMELIERLQLKYPKINFINLDDSQFKISNLYFGEIPQCRQFQIVFACHGMGKQEKWIMENKQSLILANARNKKKINAQIFMGIGGSLDFITGFTKRAPVWMQRIGLEWLWRGLQRPEHFKRIWKAVFVFGGLIIREKLRSDK